jgi:hypothetical protein
MPLQRDCLFPLQLSLYIRYCSFSSNITHLHQLLSHFTANQRLQINLYFSLKWISFKILKTSRYSVNQMSKVFIWLFVFYYYILTQWLEYVVYHLFRII